MNRNFAYLSLSFAAIIVVVLSSSILVSVSYGGSKSASASIIDTKSFPPVFLRTEDGKEHKIALDIIHDAGHTTGEPITAVNYQAQGQTINLKKGEEITITYGNPFGSIDLVRGTLLKGRVVAHAGTNENVRLVGTQSIFLQDFEPQGTSNGQVPSTIRTGWYNLVVTITYNEEIRGYFTTNVIVK